MIRGDFQFAKLYNKNTHVNIFQQPSLTDTILDAVYYLKFRMNLEYIYNIVNRLHRN